jgi:phage tail sheath protein FI
MATYTTPGTYYEAVDLDSGGINPLRTDIAAFVGIAQRGPLHTPLPVSTWEQFQSTFGSFLSQGYLAYTAKAFFENGGARCQIVRIAAQTAATATDGTAVQPADGSSSIVLSVTGFVKGAVVTLHLDATHQMDALLRDVVPATRQLVWQTPLPPPFRGAALECETGASSSQNVLLDAAGIPTLQIAASSPGTWGNDLTVEVAHTSTTSTSTRNAIQPASRLSSLVNTVSGFAKGTLVKAFQSTAVVAYLEVVAIDPWLRSIAWTTSLPVAFNLAQPISFESVEFSLSVRDAGKLVEIFTELSLSTASSSYVVDAINGVSTYISVTDLFSISPAPVNLPDPLAANLQRGWLTLAGGRDGIAAIQVADFTGLQGDVVPRGLRTLETVDEIAIVAVPDILIQPAPPVQYTPPIVTPYDPCLLCPGDPETAAPLPPPLQETAHVFSLDEIYLVQQAMVEHCERMRYRIAVLDAPLFSAAGESRELQEIQSWRQRFDSSYAALYFPWSVVYDPLQLGGNPVRMVPPSGHVVGTYATYDLSVGVHRAPANFALSWIQALSTDVTAIDQGLLNPAGINCLRSFPSRGLRVYGARTLSSDTSWQFVNVRRLLMMIEKAVEYSLQWAVFEPNNAQLRLAVTNALTVFLESVYEGGALAGSTDAQAFFVKCNASNNPPEMADAGQFLAEVGVAPAIPAEFIIFRVGKTENRLEITE